MGVYQQLESEFDYDIVEEFSGHFSQMLENTEKLILDLALPSEFSRNINELFRIFHTIKSASAYLKITPIYKTVVLGEEVLEECRTIEGAGSEALINWLLVLNDQLTAYKDNLERDDETFSKVDCRIIKVPTIYLKP